MALLDPVVRGVQHPRPVFGAAPAGVTWHPRRAAYAVIRDANGQVAAVDKAVVLGGGMAQHRYTSFSDTQVDKALRLVEQREREGWELVSMLPRPHIVFLGSGNNYGVMVIMRRPADSVGPGPMLGLGS